MKYLILFLDIFIIADLIWIVRKNGFQNFAVTYIYVTGFITLASNYLDTICNTHFFYVTAPFFIVTGTYVYIKERRKSLRGKTHE